MDCSSAHAVVVERESEAVDLLVHLRSCPHLRPQALGGYRNRNEVSGLTFRDEVRSSVACNSNFRHLTRFQVPKLDLLACLTWII